MNQLNPEHTIPTLDDNGLVIWDSHTICAYLADKYGKNDSIYPKDLALRAKVNQRLFFDAGSLFVRLRDCTFPILFKRATEISPEKIDNIRYSLNILERFLEKDPYLVGDKWTIADVSLANTVEPLEFYLPIQADRYPKIRAWLDRVNTNVPHYAKINEGVVAQFKGRIAGTLEKNKSK